MGRHAHKSVARLEPPRIAQSSSAYAVAIEAAIWGMPIVSMDAMRQAFLRDAHARYNDIVYLSKPADWQLQLTTPNASTLYVYTNVNTRRGAVVIEVPPAEGAGIFGSILDAWQVPSVDVGPEGEDHGRGGKYLLLPPGNRDRPPGYIPVRLATYNSYAVFRVPPGEAAAIRKLRVYPLTEASDAPKQRFIDMAGKLFDGIVRFDASFYASLATMLNEEAPAPRDQSIVQRLEVLGIQKGHPLSPEGATKTFLDGAARDAQTHLLRAASSDGAKFWPERTWRLPSTVGAKTHFTFDDAGHLDVDARGLFYFLACAPPVAIGNASVYLTAWTDAAGRPLVGDRNYRLRVPANVPARQFWAITAYDAENAAFVRDSAHCEVSSYDPAIVKNDDGSVDVMFSATPPSTQNANWIALPVGRKWFPTFRIYGPEPTLFEQSWKLPDIE